MDKAARHIGTLAGKMARDGVLTAVAGAGAMVAPGVAKKANELFVAGVKGMRDTFGGAAGAEPVVVTPEGVAVPGVPGRKSVDELLTDPLEVRKKGDNGGSSARGVKFEEKALAQARAEHPHGFKADEELQRLGYTNAKGSDWVGLETVKGGNYIAHITEATVGNKSLGDIGEQLDGARFAASTKVGERIADYRYYVRTDNKRLADEIRRNGNRVPKPSGSGKRQYFNVTVIFEGGSR